MNVILDSDLDQIGERTGTSNLDIKPFRDFIDKFYIVDKYRSEYPGS